MGDTEEERRVKANENSKQKSKGEGAKGEGAMEEEDVRERTKKVFVCHETLADQTNQQTDQQQTTYQQPNQQQAVELVPVWLWLTKGGTKLKPNARIFLKSSTRLTGPKTRTTTESNAKEEQTNETQTNQQTDFPVGFVTRADFSYRHGLCKVSRC